MKTSRIATAILAVVLLGCAAVAGTRALRAGAPSLPQPVPSGHVPVA